jgi:drug/metabolite transporter (DMT)-like permease
VRLRPGFVPNGYLLVTVATWGLNFVAIKEAYKEIAPPALALIRFLVMWLALAAVCLARKESLRYPRGDASRLLLLGFVSMGVYMVLFLEGMKGSAATEGAILLQTSPVFTALLAAAVRQERLRIGSLFGAAIALAGTALIIYGPGHGSNKLLSNLLVVASAITWAYSIVLMRPLLLRHSPLRVLTLSMAGGLPVMAAYGLMPTMRENWGAVSPYAWLMFFHFAILSGVVAFLCFYQGVKQVGGPAATLYQFLVPVAALLFAMDIQAYRPTAFQILGLVVVSGRRRVCSAGSLRCPVRSDRGSGRGLIPVACHALKARVL